MNQVPHQNLHQQLVELRSQATAWLAEGSARGFAPTFGICHHLTLTQCGYALITDLLAAWPDGTGDKHYPVPHPVKGPKGAYTNASASEMWNPKHKYARNRWALLDWLIEQTAPLAN